MNGDFEYELLDNRQQDTDLRRKLADLYSTPFADVLRWELRDPSLKNHGYYKLFYYEQSVLKHIIPFKYSAETSKKIIVFNKGFTISLKDIDQICRILFNEFKKLQQIIFERIFVHNPEQLPKMVIENDQNDIIIPLPESMDTYMKSLGKSTRKQINWMSNRIERDFPGFKVHYFEKSDISFEKIQELVLLNRNRMKAKGIKSYNTDEECKLLHQYASTSGFGFLCVNTIDDKIVSGTINTVIGEHAYLEVIAHDDTYNQYSLGKMALVNATKYLIEEKNIKYYHMLAGAAKYKYLHGGIDYERYAFRIFRNYGLNYLLLKIKVAIRNDYEKYMQKLKDQEFYKKIRNNRNIYNFFITLRKIKAKF